MVDKYCSHQIQRLVGSKVIHINKNLSTVGRIGRCCDCDKRIIQYEIRNDILKDFKKELSENFEKFPLDYDLCEKVAADLFSEGFVEDAFIRSQTSIPILLNANFISLTNAIFIDLNIFS